MAEQISKSARKRQFKEEENAALELSSLSDRDLKDLPGSELLKSEIRNCRGLKGGSKNRQVKYLAKVMREESVEDIFCYLAERKGSALKDNRLHREAEILRDRIVDEAMEYRDYCLAMDETFDADYPAEALEEIAQQLRLDRIDVRRTVHQFVRTRYHNHFRELFRILKAGLEKLEREKRTGG